jgi:hypothetical protein
MKKEVLYFVPLFLMFFHLNNLFSQINPDIDKWPIISDDNVNIREYPDIIKGAVNFKLYKNQKIHIIYRTNSMKKVNGFNNFWYYISVIDGKYKGYSGWVYGEYIEFKDNYDEEYWNTTLFKIKPIDEIIANRNIIAKKVINKLLGEEDDSGCYSGKLLDQYRLINQQVSFLWYMSESDFNNLNTYSTNYGYVMGFVNERLEKWQFFLLTIRDKMDIPEIFLGMTIKQVESIFGTDYKINGSRLEYEVNDYFDFYIWKLEIENNKVISFTIEQRYS